ncbi:MULTISPECIES: HAD family phosphatase [unclassified Ruminococcus]|uniref:HAD family hydrolase n=1 Tax=unclassified Ruminococcus TaxID=2608920 RepID=UPI00210B0994|nr:MULTISPECIES: HAD family phosphatase [unclassified Ruminococcus]MCQ4022606.1 HAD-IA family hydrolase [Ruminococcus sp. zg-924]MCQ4114846.1 HAD-IA family hydrolase [Ruminococcus sp. zg-921]
MSIDGIIFDFDGTLYDSMYVWRMAAGKYLLSMSKQPREGLVEDVAAMNIKQAAEYLKENYGIDRTVSEIIDDINRIAQFEYTDKVQPKDGVMQALEEIKSNGIKMCVATTNVTFLVKAAATRCSLDKYFSKYFSGTELGISKDTAQIYELALEHLGTKKENTWVFEDALYAVKTAKRAGFNVAAVYDSEADKNADEIKDIADVYLNSMKEWKKIYD